jgi:hypothetical protein
MKWVQTIDTKRDKQWVVAGGFPYRIRGTFYDDPDDPDDEIDLNYGWCYQLYDIYDKRIEGAFCRNEPVDRLGKIAELHDAYHRSLDTLDRGR